MTELTVADFKGYFRAVHASPPFPWQERLLGEVVEQGWPGTLDLPTGTGKTAALDIALFHLALEAASPRRLASLRIVLVVDRRTVVDQAFERAQKIAGALKTSAAPVLELMRGRLAVLSGDAEIGGEPLSVTVLRGGIARDDGWAKNPTQPLVTISTVDQVGSRLLFRGYGVSRSMRPIHAGLLGNDTLFLLDEVHLSEPFRQTLVAIGERYRSWTEQRLPDRWRVVSMTATAAVDSGQPFGLDADDRAHPVLRKRLEAAKPARLIEVRVTGDDEARIAGFADRLASEAAPPPGVPGVAVAVVVNRVHTARLVFERLQLQHGQDAAVFLLTGRMRPLDRVSIEAEIKCRVGAGRTPRASKDQRPTIVVATQCIEAGADLDFDVLVTECASFDALKQRFGRLNRLGEAERCAGAVLMRVDAIDEDDPIYGTALASTWAFLTAQAKGVRREIDFGISGDLVSRGRLPGVMGRPPNAPVLLPAHLDMWVQTSPVPDPDPDVSLWLHGPQRGEPEVQVVWRADIDENLLTQAVVSGAVRERLLERVEVCPPSTGEALGIPLSAVRRWLGRPGVDDTADVEGGQRRERDEPLIGRPALAWRGDEQVVVNRTRWPIEPGDTLIVPSEYGGLLNGSWAPAAFAPVSDLGDRAAHDAGAGRRRVLRLHDAVWRWNCRAADESPMAAAPPLPPRPSEADSEDAQDEETVVQEWLARLSDSDLPGWLAEAIDLLAPRSRHRIVRLMGRSGSTGSYYSLVARRRGEATTEDDVSSFTGVPVPLGAHLHGVGSVARRFAQRCGLPAEIVGALEAAGRWHDIGKADPRFQRMLHGGSAFKTMIAPEPLAKSALPPTDRRARMLARQRSGYPGGYRHELMSLALLAQNTGDGDLGQRIDRDLVLYLVSSHHGWCRPLAPVVLDGDQVEVAFEEGSLRWKAWSRHGLERLDSGVSDRFFRLLRRYGWFGLAWLEAILRLADHRRSEWEQDHEEERVK